MRSVGRIVRWPNLVMYPSRKLSSSFLLLCGRFKCHQLVLLTIVVVTVYYAVLVKLWNASFWVHNWHGTGAATPEFPGSALQQLDSLLSQNVQHVCTIAQEIGRRPTFTLCKESTSGRLTIEGTAVVSAETQNYNFEKELLEEYGNIYIFMFGSKPDILHSNKNIYYNEPWLYFLTWLPYLGRHFLYYSFRRLIVSVPKPHTILKIGNLNDNNLNPWLLDKLLEDQVLQTFQQLHIQVRIEKRDDDLIEDWVATLNKLLQHGYKLFRSRTVNECAIEYVDIEPCEVATSWLKPTQTSFGAVDGMINPLDMSANYEDKITELLAQPTISCSKKVTIPIAPIVPDDKTNFAFLTTDQWTVCMENIQQPCTVYSAKLGGTETFENSMAQLGCTVFMFDPTLKIPKEIRGPRNDIHAFNWGFGTINANIVSGLDNNSNTILNYMTPSKIATKLNHEKLTIDVLRLDLHGGEWDIIQHLLKSGLIKSYNQVVLTMHVWHGEEIFILIDRFIRLQKFLNEGFEIFYSEPLVDITLGMNEQKCCYVVGWLRKPK